MEDANNKLVFYFSNGAFLLRFNNPAGVPYSAIVEDGLQVMSCEREKQDGMISAYNEYAGLKKVSE